LHSLWSCGWCATSYDKVRRRPDDMKLDGPETRVKTEDYGTAYSHGMATETDCTIGPPTRRCAVLWLLAQTAIFQINQTRYSTLFGYIQHVRAPKRFLYTQARRDALVANFLCVVEEDWMAKDIFGKVKKIHIM
jgi:hypothetical protein